jgi:hypothetical protein
VQLANPFRKTINPLPAGKHCKQPKGEGQILADKGTHLP